MPSSCIDEIVEKLQCITCSASTPIIKNIFYNTLENHNCIVEELVIWLKKLNPLSAAFSEEGPLCTACKINRKRKGKWLKGKWLLLKH